MKVTFVIHECDYLSGPIVNLRRLIPKLLNDSFNIQVLCFYEHSTHQFEELLNLGVSGSKKKSGDYTEISTKWILEEVKKFSPDVFVSDWMPPALYAFKWLKKAGISCVASLRSDDPFFWSLMDVFTSGKFPDWSACGVFCVSQRLERKLLQRGIKKDTQLKFIPSGVTIPSFYTSSFTKLKIAYIGRLEVRQKQIIKTVKALCNATKLLPNCTVTIWGDGPEKKNIESLISKESCEGKVLLAGSIPQNQIQEELKDHNAIVLLSDFEGTPGAIMDGMAVGLVPICLKCPGGIEELVIDNKTGLITSNRNESFIVKLSLLATNPKLFRELSASARKHIHENYSLESTVNKWKEFLGQLERNKKRTKSELLIPNKICLPKLKNKLECDMRLPSKYKNIIPLIRIFSGRMKQAISKYFNIKYIY